MIELLLALLILLVQIVLVVGSAKGWELPKKQQKALPVEIWISCASCFNRVEGSADETVIVDLNIDGRIVACTIYLCGICQDGISNEEANDQTDVGQAREVPDYNPYRPKN